jgi:hypothetical protein
MVQAFEKLVDPRAETAGVESLAQCLRFRCGKRLVVPHRVRACLKVEEEREFLPAPTRKRSRVPSHTNGIERDDAEHT